ncbi:MAG: RNA polymerase sigma factor [Myxococcales bacterium]|nr:RNA polymerase sigma factor [Myxococcales bacterium]
MGASEIRNEELACVQAALDGDRDALERLITQRLPQLYSWCARLGGGRIDAEEAAHDVVLLLVRRIDTIEAPRQVLPWLFSTCQRVVANHRRRVWLQRWLPGVRLDARPAPNLTEARLEQLDQAHTIERVLDRLSGMHREVLVLCYLEERSLAEAAELLRVPTGTVKSRLHAAREAFRRHYRRMS